MNAAPVPRPPKVRVHGTFDPVDFLAIVTAGGRDIPVRARRTPAGWRFRCGECGRQTRPRCLHVLAVAQLTRPQQPDPNPSPTERTTP